MIIIGFLYGQICLDFYLSQLFIANCHREYRKMINGEKQNLKENQKKNQLRLRV